MTDPSSLQYLLEFSKINASKHPESMSFPTGPSKDLSQLSNKGLSSAPLFPFQPSFRLPMPPLNAPQQGFSQIPLQDKLLLQASMLQNMSMHPMLNPMFNPRMMWPGPMDSFMPNPCMLPNMSSLFNPDLHLEKKIKTDLQEKKTENLTSSKQNVVKNEISKLSYHGEANSDNKKKSDVKPPSPKEAKPAALKKKPVQKKSTADSSEGELSEIDDFSEEDHDDAREDDGDEDMELFKPTKHSFYATKRQITDKRVQPRRNEREEAEPEPVKIVDESEAKKEMMEGLVEMLGYSDINTVKAFAMLAKNGFDAELALMKVKRNLNYYKRSLKINAQNEGE